MIKAQLETEFLVTEPEERLTLEISKFKTDLLLAQSSTVNSALPKIQFFIMCHCPECGGILNL